MDNIPNFLEFQYKKPATSESVAQDAAPKRKGDVRYLIDCNDQDHNLFELIKYIAKNGNCGHSFSIIVDPGSESERKFGWDGDGSDRISSVTKCEKDDDLVGLLMANVNTMRWIAKGAIPDDDIADVRQKVDDPIEALKKIEYTCDTLLDGDLRDNLRSPMDLCRIIIGNCEDMVKGNHQANWTDRDAINHIKEICEGYLKDVKRITKEDDKAVAKDEDIDYGKALAKIEEEFISEAKKIGRKHECFFEAIRDDNGLYIQLQPAMDFTKGYRYEPGNQERVEDFKKFRKELDALAERLGCCRMEYICEPNSKSMSRKEKDGRDYMNTLVTSVKESVWKKAGREAAKKEAAK